MARIGLMGGTFDPVHYGHLFAAEEARERCGLETVYFIPCNLPPHKEVSDLTPAEDRFNMVHLATASNPSFCASRVELERGGRSYTIDTVREFRAGLGEQSEIYFITGADAIREIMTWRDNEELASLCRFVAVTRPGYELNDLKARLSLNLVQSIEIVHVRGLEISSTDIRRRVAEGRSIRYLTPPEVALYIANQGLYVNRPTTEGS